MVEFPAAAQKEEQGFAALNSCQGERVEEDSNQGSLNWVWVGRFGGMHVSLGGRVHTYIHTHMLRLTQKH